MFRCKAIKLFFFIIPSGRWRDLLIRRHIQKCPFCQIGLANVEEVKLFQVQEDEVGELEGLWPAVRARLSEVQREERRFKKRGLRWAFAAACLLLIAALGIWIYRGITFRKSPLENNWVERFKINYIRIEEKPASVFIFQPKDSDMVIVWAEKSI